MQALGVHRRHEGEGHVQRERRVAQLWGGPTDANAFWFKSGNDDVLNPLFQAKKLKKGPAKFVPGWLAKNAQTIFEQMLVQTNNNIQGVIAANDNIAGAVVATLKAKGLKPIPLSGQDATVAGRAEHHLRLADDDRLQVRAGRGERRRRGRDRPVQGQEAAVERDAAEREEEPAFVIPVYSITKANYTRLFTRQVPEAERGVHRGVQAVLQVAV